MATLDIIVKPKLKFSLKRCGEIVPYGITPEEKAKLAGIEENANNYILPSDVVQDANYVHTDNNFADSLLVTLSNQSGVNTGDQDLSGLVEKKANHSLVPDTEIEKLAGIEENANDYTHPEIHPASILDVVDVVNGAANKFLNERGEMVAVAHESLTNKNSEAAFQHIDTTVTKPNLDAADMVAIKDSVTGKMVLTQKNNLIDETFKKLAVRRGAVFNEVTGFYELNGLTDITEEQMMDIYNYTSQLINSSSLDEQFAVKPIRTTYDTTSRGALGVSARFSFVSSEIEVFKQNNLITNSCIGAFYNCVYLKIVDYISLGNTNAALYSNMFRDCPALETCFLRNIKANLSIQWSPLLSLASLQYIIQYRANGTTPITITVHPTVFAKLTDSVNYPTWYAVAQDALTKYITFATA